MSSSMDSVGQAASEAGRSVHLLTDWPRRILVASHGATSATPAITAGRALAERHDALLSVMTVYVPDVALPAVAERRGLAQCEASERGEAERLLMAVQRQCAGDVQIGAAQLEVGNPVSRIVQSAEQSAADLVLVGLGQPDPTYRRAGGRTPAYVARDLCVPLYAVAAGCETPTRCVVAFPDGTLHRPTLRAAMATTRPGGSLWVALPASTAAERDGPDGARDVPSDVVRELAGDASRLRLAGVDRWSDVLAGVLRRAAAVQAELIVVPISGLPGAVRSFLPSLAGALLLDAKCSVLVVPMEPSDETTPTRRQ